MTIRPDHDPGRDCPNWPYTCLICQPKVEAAGGLTLTVADGPGTPASVRALARAILYAPDPAPAEGVVRATDGRILRGPSLPCGCPLDADCTGYHPGAL